MSEPLAVVQQWMEDATVVFSPTQTSDYLAMSPRDHAFLDEMMSESGVGSVPDTSSFCVAVAQSPPGPDSPNSQVSLGEDFNVSPGTESGNGDIVPLQDGPGTSAAPAPLKPPAGRGAPKGKKGKNETAPRGWDPSKTMTPKTFLRFEALQNMVNHAEAQGIVAVTMQDPRQTTNPFGWELVLVNEARRGEFVQMLDDLIKKQFHNRTTFNSALNDLRIWKFGAGENRNLGKEAKVTNKEAKDRFFEDYFLGIRGFSDKPGFKR